MRLTIEHRPARPGMLRRLLWASCSAVALPVLLIGAEAFAADPAGSPQVPAAALTGASLPQPAPATSAPPAGASAAGVSGTARVPAAVPPSRASIGVLSHSSDLGAHSCSAAVVASTSGEVIVTAAHCVSGTGRGMVFAPGYRSGTAPHGTWVVTGAYAATGWLTGQDPQDDVVFLTVRPTASSQGTVQSAVGGYPLGSAPAADSRVRVTGYVSGVDTRTSCTTTVYWTRGYPSFDCDGFAGGTSGGPWISSGADGTPALTAVIGGLHQGGCSPDTSYSSVFDATTASVLARAGRGAPADTLPPPGSDGC